MARVIVIADRRRRQRAQTSAATLATLHDCSGSPHRAQSGGTNSAIAFQHSAHTGPRVGFKSGVLHATHDGARRTATRPSAIEERIVALRVLLRDLDSF